MTSTAGSVQATAAGNDAVAAKLAEIRSRLGILVADVSGHKLTDALAAAMLHQAFLTGVLYELDRFGEVTTRLFENPQHPISALAQRLEVRHPGLRRDLTGRKLQIRLGRRPGPAGVLRRV